MSPENIMDLTYLIMAGSVELAGSLLVGRYMWKKPPPKPKPKPKPRVNVSDTDYYEYARELKRVLDYIEQDRKRYPKYGYSYRSPSR